MANLTAEEWQAIREENRRAKIRISLTDLRYLLDLPEGVYIQHIYAEMDPASICIVVEGPELEPQPHDMHLPPIAGSWSTLVMYDDEGRRFVRWGWQQ